MIRHLTNDELAVLAASTLAETAFLLAEPSPHTGRWQHDWACAVVPFEATVHGRLVVAAPVALAAQVAAEMPLVATADEALLQAGHAVADLAGVIASAVASAIFETAGSFRLGAPSVVTCEPPLAPGERANRVTLVNEAGQPVRVELVLGNGAFSA
jgi:CheY-specific phosphatase CheX